MANMRCVALFLFFMLQTTLVVSVAILHVAKRLGVKLQLL